MARFLKKHNEKYGTAPGSLIFVGNKRVDQVAFEAILFNPDEIKELKDLHLGEIASVYQPNYVNWFNIVGLHDIEVVKQIGEYFKLHNLVQEDILNTNQRPKFEEHHDHIYIVLKVLHFNKEEEIIETEQLSLIICQNTLISFQEIEEDVFQPIRERLIRPTTKIRHRNSDYLAFALLDAIVDHYIFIIEQFGERIEALENELLEDPQDDHLQQIHGYKKEINFLRKTIRPVRELVSNFSKSDADLIDDQTLPFIKDLEDHVTQATEAIEIYREMLNDQLDIYNSGLGNKLNEIMRVLTIFSVVFIPLTFLAGIYGTNFEYLPELKFKYAYPIFWAALVLVAMGMIFFFRKRKWL